MRLALSWIFFLCFSWQILGNNDNGETSLDNINDIDCGGLDVIPLPIILPYADGHSKRRLVQLHDTGQPCQKSQEPFELTHFKKKDEKFKRYVDTLNHGSPQNQYLVFDDHAFNAGLLLGVGFMEPHTYIRANALTKIQRTRGTWSSRLSENYDEAKNLKKLHKPKTARDFQEWKRGDSFKESGISAVFLYAGASIATADVRAGGMVEGCWSKNIEKLNHNLIRISFTKEGGVGITARAQGLPLSKAEKTQLKKYEGTRIYTFDIDQKMGRKALRKALNNNLILAEHYVKNHKYQSAVTFHTTKNIRKKTSSTSLQAGIPFVLRGRKSWHKINLKNKVKNENTHEKRIRSSKTYLNQEVYRSLNLPKTNKGKKWKYFKYSHHHYNKQFEGATTKTKTKGGVKNNDKTRSLTSEISFLDNRITPKKFDKYNSIISRRVGLNAVILDTGYKKSQDIGNSEISFRLKIDNNSLESIITQAVSDKKLFKDLHKDVIDNYFYFKEDYLSNQHNDPHNLCRSFLTNKRACVFYYQVKTKLALNKIVTYLQALDSKKVRKSSSKSSTYLAKIAKKLATNQFVLQSFILKLPPTKKPYATYQIAGEKFLARTYPVDANIQRTFVHENQNIINLEAKAIHEDLQYEDFDMIY